MVLSPVASHDLSNLSNATIFVLGSRSALARFQISTSLGSRSFLSSFFTSCLSSFFGATDLCQVIAGRKRGPKNEPGDGEGLSIISNPSSSSFIDSSLFTVLWLLLFWPLLCWKSSLGSGSSSSELSVSSIMSMSAAVRRAGEDVEWRFRAFIRSSSRSALLIASGVGSKADDLKTALSPKSTAFLHVGPELRKVRLVKIIRVMPYRVENRSPRRPQIVVRARHRGR